MKPALDSTSRPTKRTQEKVSTFFFNCLTQGEKQSLELFRRRKSSNFFLQLSYPGREKSLELFRRKKTNFSSTVNLGKSKQVLGKPGKKPAGAR